MHLCLLLALSGSLGRIHADVAALTSLDGRHAGRPEGVAAARYIARNFVQAGLSPGASTTAYEQPFDLPGGGRGQNVVGLLPAGNSSSETLVIGAHYDHLGTGYPGADDNASGVAALLELARRLSGERSTLKRSVLFVAFDAEEAGALGSRSFVKTPPVPLHRIVAMLNLDMVGRLASGTLHVHGVGTSPAWRPLLGTLGGVPLTPHDRGYGPSDQSPFYAAGKPVLYFTTSTHADYHHATDTAEKIDVSGEDRIVTLVAMLAEGVLRAEKAPAFTPVAGEVSPFPERPGTLRSWTGMVLDPTLRISKVWPRSPAAKAELEVGDVLTHLAGRPVASVQDYTYVLREHEPGEQVAVTIRRHGEPWTSQMTLEKMP